MMGSGVFYRSVKPVLNALDVNILELDSLDTRPGFLQSSREDLSHTKQILRKAVIDKGGPIRVMVMCASGASGPHIISFSKDVIGYLGSYLKVRDLEGYFILEQFGFSKPPQEIADKLETIGEAPGKTRRRPEERVDFILPLYQDRPPNVESALMTCSDPKPTVLPNPFKDNTSECYRPRSYTKVIQQIAEDLKGRKKGRD